MYTSFRSTAFAAFVIVGLCAFGSAAQAIIRDRDQLQNGTGVCQPALPSYEGLIRKRPLALQNEGTASAFVSCSLASTATGVDGVRSMKSVYVYLDNSNASYATVTCTLVDGLSGTTNNYLPKAVVLSPDSKFTYLRWLAADNGGQNFLYSVNMSCNLPAGTGISATWVTYREDVGA